MIDGTWGLVTIVQIVCGFVLSAAYLALYSFRPWRSSSAGRALWIKALGNVIVLGVFSAGLLWPDYPGRPLVRFVGLTLFNVGLVYLIVVLARTPLGRRSSKGTTESGTLAE